MSSFAYAYGDTIPAELAANAICAFMVYFIFFLLLLLMRIPPPNGEFHRLEPAAVRMPYENEIRNALIICNAIVFGDRRRRCLNNEKPYKKHRATVRTMP